MKLFARLAMSHLWALGWLADCMGDLALEPIVPYALLYWKWS